MLAYLFVAIAIAVRLMFNTLGFTPLGAALLFFGSRMPRRHYFAAVAAVALSDLYLNRMYGYKLQPDQLIVWAWYIGACFLGSLLKDRVKPLYVGGASLGSSVSFFLVSNFAVWLTWTMYPKTLSGLVDCYIAAVPFFQKGLVADLVFSGIFFAIPVAIAYARRVEAHRDAAA